MSTTTTEVRRTLTGTWGLDPVHSSVGFEVPYLVGTFKGQFREAQAKLAVDDSEATLEGGAKVDSVDVKDENLGAHLQSPDFFDAERHPELRFAAEDIVLDGDTVTVRGDVTIRGVTKPVSLGGTVAAPLADPYGNERIGLVLSTTVDRIEFGLSWNTPLPSGEAALADDVTIVADLQFVKAA
jgi:polyisoprenoid-binding protein YceI